ncbi:protein FAM110A [Gadus morhua]|uniref:Family with sequence similarity 110 member A n=1 Tax=Gadus morhua TaxID=8049 RepID=A0A8C5FP60_GADMO|nr:protein FAM110A-like [Gadus morhua]XP_030222434.1 protein FAM110A-like [Gadus morhua]XP_030222443.1 protein FAM110A-like [Gadus morhua]XP_030222448.1 protein FAM110A-like [Gadus morhua]XP_030222456.1 protein FAM110A-like [Gadus morhua]
MPVETLFPSSGGVSSMPFRLLNKGPAYFRRPLAEPGSRRLSAVERLEADKAKYVKSQQVVLTRQAPVKPPHCGSALNNTAGDSPKTPIIRKPLLTPAMRGQIATPPARKLPRRPITAETGVGGGGGGGNVGGTGGRRGPALNLEILNNLINNVSDVGHAPVTAVPTCRSSLPSCSSSSSASSSSSPSPSGSSPSPSGSSPSSGTKSIGSSLSAEPHLLLLNNLKAINTTSSSTSSSKPLNTTSSTSSSKPLNTSSSTSSSKPLNTTSSTSSSKPLNTSSSLSSSSTSSPLDNRNNDSQQPPPVPVRAPRVATPPYPHPHPHPMAVRRVDVRPPAALRTFPPRPALLLKPLLPLRQTAQPQAPPTLPPPPPPPHRTSSASSSTSPSSRLGAPPPPYPPPSPAFTRLSNASSSRKPPAPALHRSKSDLSDRYSRATADLERFFNYCGLDRGEVEALGGVERFGRANSDIVSVSKLRSVSTPSSECEGEGGGEGGGGGGGGGEGPGVERAPYGISVIERNARVIKWLYGIRQARDAAHAVSNV